MFFWATREVLPWPSQSGPYCETLWPKIGIASHLLMEFHLRHAVVMHCCRAVCLKIGISPQLLVESPAYNLNNISVTENSFRDFCDFPHGARPLLRS
jgi:hypothetical protein